MQLLDFQEFANSHLQINRRANDLVVIANNTIIKGSPFMCFFPRYSSVSHPCVARYASRGKGVKFSINSQSRCKGTTNI